MPVAGREAHIHLCLVSVVRSSTSGPLVASDTDSSPAPSSQPSSLQFVAVGIRRPRCQSYVVFQSVKEPLSFHCLCGGGRTRTAPLIPGFSGNHRMRDGGPNIPLIPKLPVRSSYSGFPLRYASVSVVFSLISLSLPSRMSLLILCFG